MKNAIRKSQKDYGLKSILWMSQIILIIFIQSQLLLNQYWKIDMDKHTERILKAIEKIPSFVINEGDIVYMRLSRDYQFEKDPKPRKFLKILVQLPDSEPYKKEDQE
tara:strand:- start:914 stop:1234 length:321 start_codon:yes stop_codon:yes gene_type:complete